MTPGVGTDMMYKEVGNLARWFTVGHGKDKESEAELGQMQRSLSPHCLLRLHLG